MTAFGFYDQLIEWLEAERARGRRRVPLSEENRLFLWPAAPTGRVGRARAPRGKEGDRARPRRRADTPGNKLQQGTSLRESPALFAAGTATVPSTLPEVAEVVAQCRRCVLSEGRQQTVFGCGDPAAELMFIGEGPGREEDRQGEPFVGPAGQLLTRIIGAMGLRRDQVYIANIVKCRPPGNRNPEPDEAAECLPYLKRQIELVSPKVIVLLGAVPLRYLLGKTGIMSQRGRWLRYGDIDVMPTFHPSYLLRVPQAKREVWQDIQQVMARLGLDAAAG